MLVLFLFFLSLNTLKASGFKINEQSLKSIALSSAYVAAAYGADSSYFNPANMGFLDGVREDRHDLEIALTAIYIPGFKFSTDTTKKSLGDGSINWGLTSETTMHVPLNDTIMNLATAVGVNLNSLKDPIIMEHGGTGNTNQHGTLGYVQEGAVVPGSADTTIFPVPKIFYKSKSFLNAGGGGFNVGVAFTAPSGLAMTWNGEAGAFLKDVMIAMVELSPAISYQFREIIGIGISPRILYGMGNFNNTVYVPLNGNVLTNLQGYDEIPEDMIPAAMQELIYAVNTTTGLAGFAGLFVGGGAHYNNTLRYQMPTLFSPEAWFGMPSVDYLGDPHNVKAYNAKVAEVNATIKANWSHYQNEWEKGNLDWRYNDKTCVSQTAICLPTGFNPVPNQSYTTKIPNGEHSSYQAYKFVNGVNYCIQNGYSTSWGYGCQHLGDTMAKAKRLGAYVNCYTGTFYDFNGNLQTSNPGPCSYPSPTETDADGAPRGYLPLMDAKQLAEAFGMGNMDISTALRGSTKVDQKSNGTDLAFGYRAGVTVRPLNFKNYSLTISGVFDSPVKFNFKGKLDATTYIGGSIGDINMKADLNLLTQLPAQLKIGIAQRFYRLTLELVYERIWWAEGKKFDFAFSNPTFTALDPTSIIASFSKEQIESMMNLANYDAVAMGNGWKNTNAYRVGVSYRFDGGTVIMASAAYDESPVPQDQIGIPDSTAYVFGGGINIPITKNLSLGASATIYLKDGSKSIYQSQDGMGKLILANVSMGYSW
ncbi:transporter [Helicobacter sp. 16-1353]|nr:transporter [Helicobacter sp. 16-1353]